MSHNQLSSQIASAEPPRQRAFNELHPKDQQIKQTKKLCIEKNWQCRIHEALPEVIRPRIELKKGAKARVGDPPVEEEVWWNWSVELLKALEELSSMTENELAYAQELLMIEVEQRQANPKSSQRKILEVLLGDAQKVVDEQRKRLAVMYNTDVMQDEGGHMDMQYEQSQFANAYNANTGLSSGVGAARQVNYHNGAAGFIANIPHNAPTFQDTSFAAHAHGMPAARMHADEAAGNANMSFGGANSNLRDYTPAELAEHLKTTELKARAARLRAEALRVEAEATELEVKARVLREDVNKMEEEE